MVKSVVSVANLGRLVFLKPAGRHAIPFIDRQSSPAQAARRIQPAIASSGFKARSSYSMDPQSACPESGSRARQPENGWYPSVYLRAKDKASNQDACPLARKLTILHLALVCDLAFFQWCSVLPVPAASLVRHGKS
jgi:hypothetical protein